MTTPSLHTRTYVGHRRRGLLTLPDRTVPFTKDEPVDFTAAELEVLDPAEWSAPKPPRTRKRTAKKAAATKKAATRAKAHAGKAGDDSTHPEAPTSPTPEA